MRGAKAAESVMDNAVVLSYAREVFGDVSKTFSWLNTPNSQLDGMRPKDILEIGSAEDRQKVYDELWRIDQGVF
jgi:uncharacterized protein (DUF2384 family)